MNIEPINANGVTMKPQTLAPAASQPVAKVMVQEAPKQVEKAKVTKKEKPVKSEKKVAAPKTAAPKAGTHKVTVPKTAAGITKDVMVEMTPAKKWAVRTAGSAKALKLFDTQKEAAEYGRIIAKNNGSEIRIKSKEGKVREKASHRK